MQDIAREDAACRPGGTFDKPAGANLLSADQWVQTTGTTRLTTKPRGFKNSRTTNFQANIGTT